MRTDRLRVRDSQPPRKAVPACRTVGVPFGSYLTNASLPDMVSIEILKKIWSEWFETKGVTRL
jgi:hypothetical protein